MSFFQRRSSFKMILQILIAGLFMGNVAASADKVDLGSVTEKHVWIPMRDGVKLSAYLFTPKGKGPLCK